MDVTYNKSVEASFTLDGYPAQNAVNEDIRSWWSTASGNKGESLFVDMGAKAVVYAVQVNFGD